MISKDKLDKLGELIQQHVLLYPKLSVKAEQFESLFSVITESEWLPNNHNPNEDMITEIKGIEKPSLKSGSIKDNTLVISSHRTTKYKTLQDKIDFLKTRTYDSYICLARPNKDHPHEYNLIYINKNVIDYDSLEWVDTYSKDGSHSGWIGKDEEGTISVSIIKSMSHQVWIKVDLSKVQILRKYDFTK